MFTSSYAAGLNDIGTTDCSNDSAVDATTGIQGDATSYPRQGYRFGRDAAAAAGMPKVGAGGKGFDFSKIANNGTVLPESAALGTAAPVCTLTAGPASVPKNGTSVLTSNCTNSPASYSWTGGSCAGATAATCTVNPAATTSYGVTGTTSVGSGAASAVVTVRAIDLTPILMLLRD